MQANGSFKGGLEGGLTPGFLESRQYGYQGWTYPWRLPTPRSASLEKGPKHRAVNHLRAHILTPTPKKQPVPVPILAAIHCTSAGNPQNRECFSRIDTTPGD